MSFEGRIVEKVREIWGFDSLRPLQSEAVEAGLAGRDTLVVLPTGGGKSLCYQLPPLLEERTDVVISPLISLMKDQVDGLRLAGYPAVAIHSGQSREEAREAVSEARSGRARLIFLSPERTQTPFFKRLVDELRIRHFAIDEAHCISHWGHDFRPDYRRLSSLKLEFPEASVHAFTATATDRVRRDICEQLGLSDPHVLVGRFDRPNLVYRVRPKTRVDRQIEQVIQRHSDEAVIVYCLSRKDTESVAAHLVASGIPARAYHAGMDAGERTRVQEAFAREELNVVVATVAFGMGIDRSNVRCVIHASLPRSVEQYQQETGRAGRDGLSAELVLFYSYSDVIRWEGLIRKNESEDEPGDPELVAAQIELLTDMQRYCRSLQCRHRALARYFGEGYERDDCGACDVCLGEVPALADSVEVAQKILSCVYRLGQSFGAGHLVEVLRGADTEKIRNFGHNRLSTYGILDDFSAGALKDLVYQLIDQGLLERSSGDRPVLRLTGDALRVLRGNRSVLLQEPREPKVAKAHVPGADWGGVDRGLFESLRSLRRAIANELELPAYMIFSDATLRDLARFRPTDTTGLGLVQGVGKKKLREFGPRFLSLIREYCAERNLATDTFPGRSEPATVSRRPKSVAGRKGRPGQRRLNREERLQRSHLLFEQGVSFEEVARQLGCVPSTAVGLLAELIERGRIQKLDPWVSETEAKRIEKAAAVVGVSRLKMIYEYCGGEISYESIRLVLSWLKARVG